jgi:hypothetical protein
VSMADSGLLVGQALVLKGIHVKLCRGYRTYSKGTTLEYATDDGTYRNAYGQPHH